MQKIKIKNIICTIIFMFLTFILAQFAPTTVQHLDSGELITNTYLWRTIHPPGYPLYQIIYWPFLHFKYFNSVFFRGSLVSIILSLFSILTFVKCFTPDLGRRLWNSIFSFILAIYLFSNPIFWKYILIPDVFSLHLLISSLIIYFYLSKKINDRSKIKTLLFLFSLGITNHHTIVFLAPLLSHVAFRSYKFNQISPKELYKFIIPPLILIFLIYLIVLTTDNSATTSWGNVNNIFNLVKHFLRSDYGTFKLHASDSVSSYFSILNLYIKQCYPILSMALFVHIIYLKSYSRRNEDHNKIVLLLVCFFLYVSIFFNMANIKPEGLGKEVLLRFFLMPTLILTFSMGTIFSHLIFQKQIPIKFFTIVLMILSSINFYIDFKLYNFNQHHYFESFTIDLLNNIPKDKNTIIVAENDSYLFSLYYVQNVLQIRPELPVVIPRLFFLPWYGEKTKRSIPQFNLDYENVVRTKTIDIIQDLYSKNTANYSFFILENFNESKIFKLIFLPIGRIIEHGQGVEFKNNNFNFFQSHFHTNNIKFLKKYDFNNDGLETLQIWKQYSLIYLAKGLNFAKNNNLDQAKKVFKECLTVFPYALPALENLCNIDSNDSLCNDKNIYNVKKIGSQIW